MVLDCVGIFTVSVCSIFIFLQIKPFGMVSKILDWVVCGLHYWIKVIIGCIVVCLYILLYLAKRLTSEEVTLDVMQKLIRLYASEEATLDVI